MSRGVASKRYKPLFTASVVDNHISHHKPPPATRLVNPRPKVPISSSDTLYIVEANDTMFFRPQLCLFPHDMSTELLHSVAFGAEMLLWHSTREFIWCFVWACNLEEVVLVQQSKHPFRKHPQDNFDFVSLKKGEVGCHIRENLDRFIKDDVSTPPPKGTFEMYFGQERVRRDAGGFRVPTFKLMGITKGGTRL
jgi:hypothetical protein